VPVDFEAQALKDELAAAGLSRAPTFFGWLGVVPYLSLEAIAATLRGLPPG
jgi:O-methyltransferase involved in polyketide biosynthesis